MNTHQKTLKALTWSIFLISMVACTLPRIADAQLIDNGDGTVTDLQSGLMWTKDADRPGGSMTWDQADTWVQNNLRSQNFAGYNDWRLPSGQNPDGSVCNSRPAGANCGQTEFATLYFDNSITVYSQGPFVNIRYRDYWTSTELPSDTTRAMAQDFEDGGQNDWPKSDNKFVWAVRNSGLPRPVLYGIVSGAPNRGALIRIDVNDGMATVIGNTNLYKPCALTYDRIADRLLTQECFGQSGIHVVDEMTGAATPLGATSTGVSTLEHRHVDNFLYGTYDDINYATLYRIDPAMGSSVETVGPINKGPIGGLAAHPEDGKLFGVGYDELLNQKWLFSVRTTSDTTPLETEIAQISEDISGLAFGIDGTLFATNGSQLLKINTTTGVIDTIGSFGSDIGFVDGLAFKSPLVLVPVELWIKDCRRDQGNVPSAPIPCDNWWASPDIWIDNDGNGIADTLVPGVRNKIFARVRNATSVAADNVRVRFYYADAATSFTSIDDLMIGETTVSVAANGSRGAKIPWTPPASILKSRYCLGVRLDHANDPAITPAVPPQYDDNFAINCFGRFTVRPGGRIRLDLGSFHRRGYGFMFRDWGRQYMFQWESQLPPGWGYKAEGFDIGRPIIRDPNKKMVGSISVEAPKSAKAHSGGTLSLRQIDVATGKVIAGISIVVKADAYPPEAPRNLSAVAKPGEILLSWDPVFRESKTQKREKISYYQVFRNGKELIKVVEDIAPSDFGIQWKDSPPEVGTYTYTVRAVDEGGNASMHSTAVKVTCREAKKGKN